MAATYNRIALVLMSQGNHKQALSELVESERLGAGVGPGVTLVKAQYHHCIIHFQCGQIT